MSGEFLYSVNCWGTPKNNSLEDIEQSAAVGAQAVGLWEGKFRDGEDNAIADALKRHNLRGGFVMPHHWTILPAPIDHGGDVDWKTKCDWIAKSIKRLARFDPVGIMVGPGVTGDPNRRQGPVEHVARGLEIVADAAADYGLRIAFEPLGLRRGSAVSTIPETIALFDMAGRKNVDILFDVWHSWPDENVHAHLRRNVHRVAGVQVSDVRVPERSNFDRVFPGEGRNICTPFVATLIDAGFKGWFDFEVFSDDGREGHKYEDNLWAMPHGDFLKRGRKAFDDVFANAKKMVAERKLPQ